MSITAESIAYEMEQFLNHTRQDVYPISREKVRILMAHIDAQLTQIHQLKKTILSVTQSAHHIEQQINAMLHDADITEEELARQHMRNDELEKSYMGP